MGRNRSLDEFHDLGGPSTGEDATPGTEVEDGTGSEKAGDEVDGRATATPIEPTYDWSPGGKPCAECETVVETRWRADGSYVCAECKNW